jgi:hypothetical protein
MTKQMQTSLKSVDFRAVCSAQNEVSPEFMSKWEIAPGLRMLLFWRSLGCHDAHFCSQGRMHGAPRSVNRLKIYLCPLAGDSVELRKLYVCQ